MPAVLPALAGFGAAAWATTGFTVGIMGMGVMATSVVVGVLAGAVVGGLTAAITGGDIGEGLLYGAVGGAVGGALGGYFGPELFGSSGSLSTSVSASENATLGAISTGSKGVVGSTAALQGVGSTAAGGFFSGDMTKYALVSGGAQMFSSMTAKEPYASSEEGTAAVLASQEKRNTENNATQKELTAAQIAQQKYQTDIANQQFYANLANQQNELKETLAQRKYETDLPFAQADAARQRQRETASGLTLARKQAEASRTASTPTEQQDELNQFIYG